MDPVKKSSWLRRIVLVILIVAFGYGLVVGVLAIRQARHNARRLGTFGRASQFAWFSQMRVALQNYERVHGTLPPLCLRDKEGKPIQSWRALILPDFVVEGIKQLDISQPWNSDHNRKVADSIPPGEWVWFVRNAIPSDQSFPIFALIGKDSIWDITTGLPERTDQRTPECDLADLSPREQHRGSAAG